MAGTKSVLSALLCAGLTATAFAAAPRPSPPLEIKRTGGEKSLHLANYRGKPVLLVFLSTTCPHCQDLTRALASMAKEYGSSVQFLECAVNDEAETELPAFIAQFQTTFPVGFASQSVVNDYLQRSLMEIFWVPRIVLLDATGVIQADYPGDSDFAKNAPANIRAELDKMLKPPVAAKTAASKKK
jgi:thiol-disulfide isomerase/thioredoxin